MISILISPADLVGLLKSLQQSGSSGWTQQEKERLMTALETLTASVTSLGTGVTALTASVDNAVTHIGTPGGATDTQLTTLAGVVDGLTAAVAAQGKRLDDAVGSAPPTPTA